MTVFFSFSFYLSDYFIKYSYHLYFLRVLSHPSFPSLLSPSISFHCDDFKYHLSVINFHLLSLITKVKFPIACPAWLSTRYFKLSVSKIKYFLSGTCSPSYPGSTARITLFSLYYLSEIQTYRKVERKVQGAFIHSITKLTDSHFATFILCFYKFFLVESFLQI